MLNCRPIKDDSFDDVIAIANDPNNDIFYNHEQPDEPVNTCEDKKDTL